MRTTMSNEPLEPIFYNKLKYGKARVYLRENIREELVPMGQDENGEEQQQLMYVADEVEFVTRASYEEIANNFDVFWVQAELDEMTIEERLAEQDALISALIDVVLDN